jgi:hypothetical protein
VIGQVFAVCLAHCVSLQAHSDRRSALRSPWPMVALMIGYTMTSLWIIAWVVAGSAWRKLLGYW